jgi:hypothetical protein
MKVMNHRASTNDDTKDVDQTILWAREALQRRRRELLEQKNKLLLSSSYSEGRTLGLSETLSSPGTALSSTGVQSTLERGRALLAEVDARSEKLRKYASIYNIGMLLDDGMEDPKKQIQWTHRECNECMTTQDTICSHHYSDSIYNTCGSISETSVESPHLDKLADNHGGGPEETLREVVVRERLDELVTNIVRQEESITPEKRISNFDPSTMKSAKRAKAKKIQLDEAVAAAEEQARLLTSFKALPLPGGVEVANNLYATTQSFEGKHIGSVEKLIRRRDTAKSDHLYDESSSIFSGKLGTRDDFSSLRSLSSCDKSFMQSEFENDADRERARELLAEKKMKKRQLLESVSKIVSEDMRSVVPEEHESYDLVEDPSKLRQDIARLEAKLKQKKTQRDATLNDIVDFNSNDIFDRFLPGETSDYAKQIIDRLKERAFCCVGDFRHVTPTADNYDHETLMNVPQQISVVQRQEEWSKRREQKLFNARMQLEANAMDGVTGKPEISQTVQSWKRAKESHDETLKIIAEAEEKKSWEKAVKEKALNEMKAEEERQLQEQSKPKQKLVKSVINKEEQKKRLEMLSRPRQTVEAKIHLESSTDTAMSVQRPDLSPTSRIIDSVQRKKRTKQKKEKKVKSKDDWFSYEINANKPTTAVSSLDKKPDEFYGVPSFSDMSDKEFAKLVKRISKNASAKVQASEIMP